MEFRESWGDQGVLGSSEGPVVIRRSCGDHDRRMKKSVELRIGVASWNVGRMTGNGRVLVEVLKKASIGIVCVQVTSGKSAR